MWVSCAVKLLLGLPRRECFSYYTSRKIIPVELVIFLHNAHTTLILTRTDTDLSDWMSGANGVLHTVNREGGSIFWKQPWHAVVKCHDTTGKGPVCVTVHWTLNVYGFSGEFGLKIPHSSDLLNHSVVNTNVSREQKMSLKLLTSGSQHGVTRQIWGISYHYLVNKIAK